MRKNKAMDKQSLRKKQLDILNKFAATNEKANEDEILLEKFINSKLVKDVQTIGITSSLIQEVDTSKIIAYLWDKGKDVFLAKIEPKRTMHFVRYTYDSKIVKNKMGIEEVAEETKINDNVDLLVVPGLAFAADSHHRLGFGGGFYDRFLADHPNIQTVSLVNSHMLYQNVVWPVEKTDIPVETLITTDKMFFN